MSRLVVVGNKSRGKEKKNNQLLCCFEWHQWLDRLQILFHILRARWWKRSRRPSPCHCRRRSLATRPCREVRLLWSGQNRIGRRRVCTCSPRTRACWCSYVYSVFRIFSKEIIRLAERDHLFIYFIIMIVLLKQLNSPLTGVPVCSSSWLGVEYVSDTLLGRPTVWRADLTSWGTASSSSKKKEEGEEE